MLTRQQPPAHFPRQRRSANTGALYVRRGCFVGIRSARLVVRIVLERPGLVCAAHHERHMRDHEVNQTKPEHPLTWRSVQIALGMSASGISPSLRCQLRQPPELSSQRKLCLFKHGYFVACGRLRGAESHATSKVVEPDGIEPTTSCLQSTRSPS